MSTPRGISNIFPVARNGGKQKASVPPIIPYARGRVWRVEIRIIHGGARAGYVFPRGGSKVNYFHAAAVPCVAWAMDECFISINGAINIIYLNSREEKQ